MKVEYLGKTYNVNDEALRDADIFEEIVEVQSGNMMPVIHVMKSLLGEDGYKTLKDSLRDEKGHARIDEVIQAFGAIMTAAGEDKKK